MPAGKPLGPPRGARMKSSVKNPGKIFGRLMKLIGKHYTPHLIAVVICMLIYKPLSPILKGRLSEY